MSNSEQNKNWKQELEQIELHSSDLSFEKAAAWDKLYDRLEKPESKKRAGWFKWAAVFIAISSLLTYYMFSKSTVKPSEQPTIVNESKANESIQNNLATEPNISTEPVIEKKESIVKKEIEPNTNRSKELKFVQVTNAEIANIPSATIDIPNTMSIAAPVADTLRNITIAASPEKKKLRVIHINDYAVPVKPDIFMADNIRPGARNLIRLNTVSAINESSTETLPVQTSPSIKIKLSPQN